MKVIFYSFLILLLFILILAVYGGYVIKKNVGEVSFKNFIKFFKSRLDEKTKAEVKEEAKKLEEKVYQEAEKHNPKGDVVPDEWDDKIKKKLKEEIKGE